MKASEKKALKQIISDKILQLQDDIVELTELTRPIPLDASIGRVSRMDAINNRSVNEASLREKKSQLSRLQKATDRLNDKNFGKCSRCGNDIPFGRLEYMPYTTRCVQCAG